MISKENKRLLNQLYIKTRLEKFTRYPIHDTRYSYDENGIQYLIDNNYLEVFKHYPYYRDDFNIDCIKITEKGKSYITSNTEYYVNERLQQKMTRHKKHLHRVSVEHYHSERNPWMGTKLTRNGAKVICTKCYAINKPCEHGVEYHQKLPVSARPPKANASKTRWKAFKDMFIKDSK